MNQDRHSTTRTELLGKLWLRAQLTHDGVETATPARDVGIDLISYDADGHWVVPLQLKVSNTGGLRVEEKYLGKQVALVYVFLGPGDGGPADRGATSAHILTPEQAWALPGELGRKFSPHDNYYNFGRMPRLLLARLARYRVNPGEWATRLRDVAAAARQHEGSGHEQCISEPDQEAA